MKLVFSIYLTLAFWLMNMLYIVVLMIPFLIISFVHPAWSRAFAVGWGRAVINSLFLPRKFYGFENIPDYPVVIASNHTSMLDIHLTLGYFPKRFHFLMKEELFKIPLFGLAVRVLGFFPINRKNPRRAKECLDKIVENLKKGESVLIYPEGTRNPHGELLPFKNGMAKLAADAQVPILPIVVQGCSKVKPSAKKLLKYYPVSITVGQPIQPPKSAEKVELQRVNQEVMQAMRSMLSPK